MKTHAVVLPAGLLVLAISFAKVPSVPAWKKHVLTKDFITEGLAAGDIDGDGVMDLVAGHLWFKGPDFKEVTRFKMGAARPVTAAAMNITHTRHHLLRGRGVVRRE